MLALSATNATPPLMPLARSPLMRVMADASPGRPPEGVAYLIVKVRFLARQKADTKTEKSTIPLTGFQLSSIKASALKNLYLIKP